MVLSGGHNSGGSVQGSYIRISWSATQNQGANTSTINATLQLILQGGTSIQATENGNITIDGTSYGYSRGTTNRGPNGTYTLHTASRTITHNSNGTRSFSISGSFTSGWVTFGTLNTGSQSYILNTIPRYAAITSWPIGSITEKSVNVTVNTDVTCDLVDYAVNNGSWVRGYTGNFTSRTFTIPNLDPATTYSIKIRVRRQSSGLYTETSNKSATTLEFLVSSLTSPSATDTTIDITAVANYTADLLQYRIQGDTTWITAYSGNFTSRTFSVTDLTSETAYTFEVRARHAERQTYTPIATVSNTTQDPQPLQPTQLSPSGAQGVGTLEPTLSWQYNATSPDIPSAYQVIIRLESDGSTVWDSGKIEDESTTVVVPENELDWNINYQWQVRAWSSGDIQGPYSSLALFKTSQPPVVTVTAPTHEGVVSSDQPIIEWTYSDPESTAQTGFNIRIERIQETGEQLGTTVLNQTVSPSEDVQYTVPTGILVNGGLYILRVTATDSDGVPGQSSLVEFEVSYVAPPLPSIDVELSDQLLFAQINVSPNNPANNAYDSDYIRIYKRELGTLEWQYVGEVFASQYFVDQFEDDTYTLGGVVNAVTNTESSRQGNSGLGIETSGSGTGTITTTGAAPSLVNMTKMRAWIYALDTDNITSLTYRIGTDDSNYYQFVVPASALENGEWVSYEVEINSLEIVGSPSLGDTSWRQIVVSATTELTEGDLIIDAWSLVPALQALFVYDYLLQNGVTYEYAATGVNSREGLESEPNVYGQPVAIEYDQMLNTYLIPVHQKSLALIAFVDRKMPILTNTNVETAYFEPVGAKHPTVYSLGTQQYRKGNVQLRFFDGKFGYAGRQGIEALDRIMNEKPLMLRTWWGDILYISIDGQISVDRIPGVAWTATFSFTEIQNDGE